MLSSLKRDSDFSQQLVTRCRIVLECASGAANTEVAGRLEVARATVGKYRDQVWFTEQRRRQVLRDRTDTRAALWRLARRQRGYFTAAQARDIGYSYQAQRYHAKRGNWLLWTVTLKGGAVMEFRLRSRAEL